MILQNRLSQEAAEKNMEGPGRDQVTGEVTGHVTGQVTGHVTEEIKRLLESLQGEMSRTELQETLGLKHRDHFSHAYLLLALDMGFLERTIPDKPKSRLQKYRLAAKGKALVTSLK